MSDRELLELAAKAAGLNLWTDEYDNLYLPDPMRRWNPLQDDGDALRLAVKLRISISVHTEESWAQKYQGESDGWLTIREPVGDDPFAATRRAIVRAAAEIQRDKEAACS